MSVKVAVPRSDDVRMFQSAMLTLVSLLLSALVPVIANIWLKSLTEATRQLCRSIEVRAMQLEKACLRLVHFASENSMLLRVVRRTSL